MYNLFYSKGHGIPLVMTQVSPNPSEVFTNHLDQHSKVNNMIIN